MAQAYWIEGSSLRVGEQDMKEHVIVTLNAGQEASITNTHATVEAEVLILQGKPINETVVQVSLSLSLRLKGLFLYTGGVLFHVECCCIRQL